MDFCDNRTVTKINLQTDLEDEQFVFQVYRYVCPILIIASLFSLILNGLLFIVRRKIQQTPIILLSLNLSTTDALASFLIALSILLNSYLPVIFEISINRCFLLTFEILRMSALVASVFHLLALTWLHYQGAVNPLQHRLYGNCRTSGTIYSISISSWLVPILLYTIYFNSIPCQGFRSESCDILFLITFKFRMIVFLCFTIPLMVMFVAYVKIFYVLNYTKTLNYKQKLQTPLKSYRLRGIRQSYKKTAITSLIIVGTYVFCWLPGIMWYILSCIDGCPFPLIQQTPICRMVLGFTTNGLIILKAVVDPFIYSYRMKEIKVAIKSFLMGVDEHPACSDLNEIRSGQVVTTDNSFV